MEVKSEEKQMKYVIGDINKFAIQYILMPNPYDERGVIGQSWGRLDLWVSGKNLCQYKVGDTVNVYIWNLFYVIEWFCENLHHILGYDPFPLPVKGENTLELIQKADTFDIDEEDENYLWHHAKRTWIFRHTWFPNRGGSRLPSVYFRRVGENIEIAWNNNFYENKSIEFVHSKGVGVIPKKEFKGVVFAFLNNILDELDLKISERFQEDKKQLIELREKLKLLE